MRIQKWSQEEASRELLKRIDHCFKYRARFEGEWRDNEEVLFGTGRSPVGVSPDELSGFGLDSDVSDSDVELNYAFKYVRFIHAQGSANPPSAIPHPTSQDMKDRKAANVADHLIQHGQRDHKAQEHVDHVFLDSQVYGTGFIRCWFNPFVGDIYDVNEETEEVTMNGDNEIRRLDPWKVWFDPDADVWDDVRYIFIEHTMPIEQAVFMWPQHEDALRAQTSKQGKSFWNSSVDVFESEHKEVVSVYEYIEKGLPWNGNVGRYAWMLDTGLLLSPLSENPFPNAKLPLHPLTDIDLPGHIYGKAITSYLARAQAVLEALDSTILDNIQAHGVIRMVLPDGAEIQDEGINNHGWEYVKTSGNAGNAPFFMSTPQLMPDMHSFRAQLIAGMEALAGVNESMFGQQSREMSGFSMQTAINAGNMIRRRLFNKYTLMVRWLWLTYLDNVKEFWDDERKILITGEEDALSVAYYSGADLDGGFDLQVDYGQSFSLDPAARREEIMQLAPMLEKAGMSAADILSKIKLNDIKGVYNIIDLAAKRQEEIFEEMIAKYESGVTAYIAPRQIQEHQGMLAAAYKYIMTKRFDNQPEEVKRFIERHIEEREGMAGTEAAQPGPEAAIVPPPPGMGIPMA